MGLTPQSDTYARWWCRSRSRGLLESGPRHPQLQPGRVNVWPPKMTPKAGSSASSSPKPQSGDYNGEVAMMVMMLLTPLGQPRPRGAADTEIYLRYRWGTTLPALKEGSACRYLFLLSMVLQAVCILRNLLLVRKLLSRLLFTHYYLNIRVSSCDNR